MAWLYEESINNVSPEHSWSENYTLSPLVLLAFLWKRGIIIFEIVIREKKIGSFCLFLVLTRSHFCPVLIRLIVLWKISHNNETSLKSVSNKS